jgi:D-alanyl-lipoteichoic acid acyltransferase DltB (MBOAT superfamily)
MCVTFFLTAFAFIFFRAETVGKAFTYISRMFSNSNFAIPDGVGRLALGSAVLSILILIIVEWINRKEEYGFRRQSKYKAVRWLVYIIITMMILELARQQQDFIYFQF